MGDSIIVVTSIAPKKNIDNQIKAIDSWQKIGFNVVALNTTKEIAEVQHNFPDVKFIAVQRDGSSYFGKPYIFIDDIFAYLSSCNANICGIVNSDIHFINYDFYDFVNKEALDAMVYGSRIDVNNLENLTGDVLHEGFDYFFFNKNTIDIYPPVELFMGLPCWDYWAVLVPLFCGMAIKNVITPHAYHIKHQTNWDNNSSSKLYQYSLLKYFKPLTRRALSPYYMLGLIYKYSISITLTGEQKALWVPEIKQVINNGQPAVIIDDLLFLNKIHGR